MKLLQGQIADAYSFESIEERYFLCHDYNLDRIEQHRRDYSLDERKIFLKDWNDMSENERGIYAEIWKRSLDALEANADYVNARNEKFKRIIRHVYHNELEKIFQSQFSVIKITRESYNKAEKIARSIVNNSNSANEIYIHPLNRIESEDGVIRDTYIPFQSVMSDECSPNVIRESEDFDEIKNSQMKIIGWMHSHGHFNNFHSPKDYTNLKFIPAIYGQKKTLFLDTFSSENPRKFEISYLPSIIINAKNGKPSVKISLEYNDFDSFDPKIFINESPMLEIIDENNGIKSDDIFIEEEIWNKVETETGFRQSFTDRMNSSENVRKVRLEEVAVSEEDFKIKAREYVEILKQVERAHIRIRSLEDRILRIERAPRRFG